LDIDPGTVVANRYRITRPLGRGGMGEVFAAENIRTGRPVAVKLLRSDTKAKSSAVARFRREARAAGSINSDHVTQVLDVEEDAEHGIVLVFELLEGESLIDRLKRLGPMSFDELHPVIEQVWLGLADAHRAGIIHRDLKPSNVFLEHRPDGTVRVKILDFGISKLPKEMGGETLTEMGQSLGTFSFMPPEQIGKAKTVDHRADIYAGATMIYQALSGQLPYAARNILVMVDMKTKSDPRSLEEAMGSRVDARLEAFLTKGLARNPGDRFQTAVEALAAWRDLRPQQPQRSEATGYPQRSDATPYPQRSEATGYPQRPDATPYPRADPPRTPRPEPAAYARAPQSVAEAPARALPSVVEMSTDSGGATMSMKVPGRGNSGTQPIQASMEPAPTEDESPGLGLGGTIRVNVARLALDSDVSGGYDEKSGNLPAHPAGYYLPPAVAASLHASRSAPQVPVMNIEDPPSMPASSEQTRVYRPRGAPPILAPKDESVPQTWPEGPDSELAPRRAGTVRLVLGAIAFALVGFGIVAAILQYLRR
jgi:eukaryotic-like serine/threonine-protein kinase